jgi:hypothetical protein
VSCAYLKEVWLIISHKFNTKSNWSKLGLVDCVLDWFMDAYVSCFKSFPCHLVYVVWWAHNVCIFHDILIPMEVTTSLVEIFSLEHKYESKFKITRVRVMPQLKFDILWGFFDGAS